MSSTGVVDREAITAAFDVLDAAVEAVGGLNFDIFANSVAAGHYRPR